MNRFGKIMLSGLFILFLFIFGIYMILTEDHQISHIENRTLAQTPDLSTENIITGQYMKDVETYITDQFPGRDVWLKTYTNYQVLSGKTYVNDYYIGAEDWIMPKPSQTLKEKGINSSSETINELAQFLQEEEIEFYYFMVPHKVTLFQSIFPDYINESKSEENKDYFLSKLDEDIVTVDMANVFRDEFTKEEIESMYFKTDHHWNGKGALEAYKLMSNTFKKHSDSIQVNEESLKETYYQKECLSPPTEFVGSYNRQIYMTVNSNDHEKMCVYLQEAFTEYKVYANGEKKKPEHIYFNVSAKDEVSYSDLYTRDFSELTIINPNVKAGKMLVIKDSYANALVYHLAQNFHQTTFYDVRHNEGESVRDYILENDFDYVAVIYNSENLSGSIFEFGKSN
ncbi:DHHW family protein [Ornithinibacillus halotolerans]|uniref:Membrane protein n=1 Tax=Ornithinibacillus halotolerans TaxID=1274357 RepID=A0A916RPV2_9BACI|nr:DHHW family protein [Ornithinibacillus halotolerans]GGA64865.1 membrane protein [Ornithinibacillus halotolerans]